MDPRILDYWVDHIRVDVWGRRAVLSEVHKDGRLSTIYSFKESGGRRGYGRTQERIDTGIQESRRLGGVPFVKVDHELIARVSRERQV